MTLERAIEILEAHQEWRKGADTDMIAPSIITEAIDTILKHLKK